MCPTIYTVQYTQLSIEVQLPNPTFSKKKFLVACKTCVEEIGREVGERDVKCLTLLCNKKDSKYRDLRKI